MGHIAPNVSHFKPDCNNTVQLSCKRSKSVWNLVHVQPRPILRGHMCQLWVFEVYVCTTTVQCMCFAEVCWSPYTHNFMLSYLRILLHPVILWHRLLGFCALLHSPLSFCNLFCYFNTLLHIMQHVWYCILYLAFTAWTLLFSIYSALLCCPVSHLPMAYCTPPSWCSHYNNPDLIVSPCLLGVALSLGFRVLRLSVW